MMHALAAAPIASLLLGSCSASNQLHGLPEPKGHDAKADADHAENAVHRTAHGWARGLEHKSKVPPLLNLLDAYVALANDRIGASSGLEPEGTRLRKQPLFLYPRTTSPHISESTRGDGGSERGWIVPVLLNRDATTRRSPYSFLLGEVLSSVFLGAPKSVLPRSGSELMASLQQKWHFTLLPRSRAHHQEIPGDDGIDTVELLTDIDFCSALALKDGIKDEGVQPREDALELVFHVPASSIDPRWDALGRHAEGAFRPTEELFDLRVFAKLKCTLPERQGAWREALAELSAGRWPKARKHLARVVSSLATGTTAPDELGVSAGSLRSLESGLIAASNDLPFFRSELRSMASDAASVEEALLENAPIAEIASALRRLERAVGAFVDSDPSPAPVLLDGDFPDERSFSFVVGADLQYDSDGSALAAFLSIIDPLTSPNSGTHGRLFSAIPKDLQEDIQRVKFALIVGDLGDGAGLSSSGLAPVADALGLTAPHSPYADRHNHSNGEFPELREQLRRSSKAIFAVPGNHDGFAAYGGVLNQLTAGAGHVLQALPLLAGVGDWLVNDFSDDLPTLVRLFRITPPFYDGLVDWSYELGPRNIAFHYKSCAFVGLNSFDLLQIERDQVGALGNNWGGGLQDASLVWFDVALRHFGVFDRRARRLEAADRKGTSFVFMHHDPRGSLASKTGYQQTNFGKYSDVTSPMNELTLGWFGLGWASYTGIFIPVISPLANDILREAIYGADFQERWMRKTAWDQDCYNARGLLEAINRNLSGAPSYSVDGRPEAQRSADIGHLFFGHDDTPVIGRWVSDNGRSVFPNNAPGADWSTFRHWLAGTFNRSQSQGPPSWAEAMAFDDGRNSVVVRMDDLGDIFLNANSHGFHLVTVTFPDRSDSAENPQIRVRRIPIPR